MADATPPTNDNNEEPDEWFLYCLSPVYLIDQGPEADIRAQLVSLHSGSHCMMPKRIDD